MMVAIAILSISLGVLYQAVSGATRNVSADEKYAFGVELARSLLADNARVPIGGLSLSGETAGGFQWELESIPMTFPRDRIKPGVLQDIQVVVAWEDGRTVRRVVLDSVVEGVQQR